MEINTKYLHLLTLCHNMTIPKQTNSELHNKYSVVKYDSVIGLIAASNDGLYFINLIRSLTTVR